MNIKFGPAGNSESFYAGGGKGTEEAPAYLNKMGLDAFEYSFGRGTFPGEEKSAKIKAAAEKFGVTFSAHAPYYINFASDEPDKSIAYVLRSLAGVKAFGGRRVIFHSASASKTDRGEAFNKTKKNIEILLKAVDEAGFSDYTLCPETMGKKSQIGTAEEVAELCTLGDNLTPCIDFGHVNSLTQGGLKTKDDYRRIIETFYAKTGEKKTNEMHIHFSKIQYGAAGEIRHLTFADTTYGPAYEPLMELIREYKMTPTVICESDGTMAEDTLAMKKYYDAGGAGGQGKGSRAVSP